MATVGLIGVGLLGSAIATRLQAAGYTVLGYDIIPSRCIGATSSQQVFDNCKAVMLSLPTSDVVAQVIAEVRIPAGITIIDTTTGEPETMAAMGAKLARTSV